MNKTSLANDCDLVENEGKHTAKYAAGVGSARNIDLLQEITSNYSVANW